MRTKSIDLVWIVVKDFKQAVKFYSETIGLKVVDLNEEWGWAELQGHDGKGMRLGIAQQNAEYPDPVKPGENYVATFTVDDLDQSNRDLIKQGVTLIGDIQDIPGHVRMQAVKDTEGNFFQVVQRLSTELEQCAPTEKKTGCCAH